MRQLRGRLHTNLMVLTIGPSTENKWSTPPYSYYALIQLSARLSAYYLASNVSGGHWWAWGCPLRSTVQ